MNTDPPDRGTPGGPCIRRPGARSTSCRCSPTCVQLEAAYNRTKRERHEQGTPGRMPASRAQTLIRVVMRRDPTLTYQNIADRTGVSRRTIALLMDAAPDRTINTTTATKLAKLTVPLTPGSGSRNTTGIGARRMIEALMVAGWPQQHIAQLAGLNRTTLSPRNLATGCTQHTLAAIQAVFNTHKYEPGPSDHTTRYARTHGYLPWHAWGTGILNPNTHPDLTWCEDPTWVAAYQQRNQDRTTAA